MTRVASAEDPASAVAVATYCENCFRLLLVKPAEKFLKPFIGADFLHGVEVIAQFVMRPNLMDEIFTTVARRRDFASAIAARHDMSARGTFRCLENHRMFFIGPTTTRFKMLVKALSLAARSQRNLVEPVLALIMSSKIFCQVRPIRLASPRCKCGRAVSR